MIPPPAVSVVMSTFNQAAFLLRAVASLRNQTLTDWELIVVDDGSTDDTPALLSQLSADPRIRMERLERNRGLGAALNRGLDLARAPRIAYLPSDDVYYRDHLASLVAVLDTHPEAVLAMAGVRHHHNRTSPGVIPGFSLQLVQAMHRAGPERWVEREELVSDDLERLFWGRLVGERVESGRASCEWVEHVHQRHRAICEPLGGGLNPYRRRYGVSHPLRFHSSAGNFTDEVAHYRRFRERPPTHPAPDGLKILLVGELAYNPERVLALEERGHRLFGLWIDTPWWFNTVGPLPFGHVEDLPRDDWQGAIRRLRPDVIYALLNWQAVEFAHTVLTADLGIPFVWHFKEGPWLCLDHGLWPKLVELVTHSDGRIFTSPEQRDWFALAAPGSTDGGPTLVLDGDLPKREWFDGELAPRLSEGSGEFHTVVPGRPIGLTPEHLGEMARLGIHLHFYGDINHGGWKQWVNESLVLAPGQLHLHSHVGPEGWVSELSRYDAGWLHFLPSDNGGDLEQASWDDLNYPARMATLAAAGLPLIQYDNAAAIVAAATLTRTLDVGLFCRDMAGLAAQLADRAHLDRLRTNLWRARPQFTFDHHADRLVAFFRRVIAG